MNHRATGIIFNNNKVLLCKAENDGFWSLPGSWVTLLESPEDALKKGIEKELNTEIRIDRLIWIVENYSNNKSYNELYFLITISSDSPVCWERNLFKVGKNGTKQIFKWQSLEELKDILLYPSFLHKFIDSLQKGK